MNKDINSNWMLVSSTRMTKGMLRISFHLTGFSGRSPRMTIQK